MTRPAGNHTATFRRLPVGRDAQRRLTYLWISRCRCGDHFTGPSKHAVRAEHVRHRAGEFGWHPPSPRLLADAVNTRIALEQARSGLVAALLNPDRSALRGRAAEIADMLTDLLDRRDVTVPEQRQPPDVIVLPA